VWRRRRRRDRAVTADARIALAWEESLEDLELVGVVRGDSETHTEYAQRAGHAVPETRTQIDDLATLADFVAFAPDTIDEREAERADAAAASIAETVHARVSARDVWLRRLDPRELLGGTKARAHQQARASKG